MPHSLQRNKRLRQAEKQRVANRARSTRMKTEIKRVLRLVDDGDMDGAKKALPEAFRRIDKAAKQRVIHKNSAGHKKSLLARRINAAENPTG